MTQNEAFMEHAPIIDERRCTRCGRCVEVCPKGIVVLRDDAVAYGRAGCMRCAHCYAVCAFDAISFDPPLVAPSFTSFPYAEEMVQPGKVRPGDLVNLLRSRRSVRRYAERPVPDEAMADLVAFAVTAPSGSNCQRWEFTVVNGRAKVEALGRSIGDFFTRLNRLVANPIVRALSVLVAGMKLVRYYRDHYASVAWGLEQAAAGRDPLFHGAPGLIIIHGRTDGSTPLEDAQYAGYNICLLGHALGLGSCFIGYAVEVLNRDTKLRRSLEIPPGNRVLAVIALGYPAVRFLKPALRNDYTVQWL